MQMEKTGEFRRVRQVMRRHGWTIGHTKRGHLRFIAPDGRKVFAPGSPSDHRAVKNMVAFLRREGLPV